MAKIEGYGLRVACRTVLAVLAMGIVERAAATEAPHVLRDRLGEIGFGSLLLDQGDPNLLLRAPAVETEVDISVRGIIGRARVRQTFRNGTDGWAEGVYVFPLPENAAVDRLVLRIGERVVEGRVKERGDARRVYETARRQGRRAGLVESERPNLFTTSIANIGPGERVSVEIEYQQTLRFDDGRVRLRFPMVVGPRYIPGGGRSVSYTPAGPVIGTARVPDAGRISPPVLHPASGKVNPVRLTATVDAGFPLAAIESLYHAVAIDRQDGRRYRVRLEAGTVPADRDFELVWTPEVREAPAATLFRESVDGADYLMVMVMPPTAGDAPAGPSALRREVILVLDTSGSMGGTSIIQAKAALLLAVDRLADGDRFNVLRFANDTSALFAEPRPVDAASRARARAYVRSLSAGGGTEMAPALAAALAGGTPEGYLRQVVFLTDGAVGNEAELFGLIERRLGGSRLFTVGIGSAPNSYFMREAAEAGRGTFTHIGKLEEVGDRMARLFEKLERPVLTDIGVDWPPGAEAEVSAGVLPDLYAGEPVVFTARLASADGVATLVGRLGERRWRANLPLARAATAAGIARLWARDRIDDLMGSLRRDADAAAVRAEVVALGLGHRLVTRYTSLVAVDATPARPAGAPLVTGRVPLNLPRGWTYEGVFGGAKRPPPPDMRDAALRPAPAMTVASTAVRIGGPRGLALPQTATAAPLHLVIGLVLAALGLLVMVVLVLRRRWS